MGPYEYVSDVDLKQLIIIYDNNQQQFVVMLTLFKQKCLILHGCNFSNEKLMGLDVGCEVHFSLFSPPNILQELHQL